MMGILLRPIRRRLALLAAPALILVGVALAGAQPSLGLTRGEASVEDIERMIARWNYAQAIPEALARTRSAGDRSTLARAHLLAARAFAVKGIEYRDAAARYEGVRHLGQAFSLEPTLKNEPDAAWLRANLATFRHPRALCLAALEEARRELEDNDRNPQAHFYLGMVYHFLTTSPEFSHSKAEQDSLRQQAVAAMAQAVRLNDRRYEYWAYYITVLINSGLADEARQAAQEMAEKCDMASGPTPASVAVPHVLAAAFLPGDEGRAHIRRQAEQSVGDGDLQLQAAMTWAAEDADLCREKLEFLLRNLDQGYLRLAPWRARTEMRALYRLAGLYSEAEELNNSLATYDRIIQLSPYYAEARFNRGVIYRLQAERAEGAEQRLALLRKAEREFAAQIDANWQDRYMAAREQLDQTRELMAELTRLIGPVPVAPSPQDVDTISSAPLTPQTVIDLPVTVGQGVGPLRLGAPADDVWRLLGEPHRVYRMDDGSARLDYQQTCYMDVLVSAVPERIHEIHLVKGFLGRTGEGIQLDMSLEEVLEQIGRPIETVDATAREISSLARGRDRILYRQLLGATVVASTYVDAARGVSYVFDKSDQLVQITLFSPDATLALTGPPVPGGREGDVGVDLAIRAPDIFAFLDDAQGWMLAARVHNLGRTPQSVDVSFFDGLAESGGQLIGQTDVFIEPGAKRAALIAWDPPAGSTYVQVMVDPDNLIAEDNEINNLAGRRITIQGDRAIHDQLLTDDIQMSFVNDPLLPGTWRAIDLVETREAWSAQRRTWRGQFPLREIGFQADGQTSLPNWTWTRGVVINRSNQTAARYEIRREQEDMLLFMEWKGEDYTIRHMRAPWLVLRREGGGLSGADGLAPAVFGPNLPAGAGGGIGPGGGRPGGGEEGGYGAGSFGEEVFY